MEVVTPALIRKPTSQPEPPGWITSVLFLLILGPRLLLFLFALLRRYDEAWLHPQCLSPEGVKTLQVWLIGLRSDTAGPLCSFFHRPDGNKRFTLTGAAMETVTDLTAISDRAF